LALASLGAMSDQTVTTPAASPRFEIRPSPLKTWNPDAPDEYVNLDAKPLGFGDLLEAFNPLQHLPVIGSVYRSVTGATIEPAARVVGGMLFGGMLGAASAVVNSIVEGISGKDAGEHVIAMISPGAGAPVPPPSVAPAGGDPLLPANSGELHYASFGTGGAQGGTYERQGLLTTWVATGAPQPARPTLDTDMRLAQLEVPAARPVQMAGAIPVSAAMFPAAAPAARTPDAPVPADPTPAAQTPAAAPAPPPAAAPVAASGEMRAMSLDSYRARAHAVMDASTRSPAVNDTLGLGRRAEAARALATYRSQAQTNALPAALQAQEAYDGAGESAHTFFSASMALGLERYRQLQLQRDEASRRGI
jgi:hypothetical protein